jgi:hypothetical protein
MNSSNQNKRVPPPWGDDMESALAARDTVLRGRADTDTSRPNSRRVLSEILVAVSIGAVLIVLSRPISDLVRFLLLEQ